MSKFLRIKIIAQVRHTLQQLKRLEPRDTATEQEMKDFIKVLENRILTNIDKLPYVLSSIFNQAFFPDAVYGGFIGALVTGIKRAVFSNEGGVGSASIAFLILAENPATC